MGKVPLLLGYTSERAEVRGETIRLHLRATDGAQREIEADNIICATGYRVNVNRLEFLNPEIRSKLTTLEGSPVLSINFESSVRGLHFVGVAAANSFGPLMRFAYGAGFTARHLTRALMKVREYGHAPAANPSVIHAAD